MPLVWQRIGEKGANWRIIFKVRVGFSSRTRVRPLMRRALTLAVLHVAGGLYIVNITSDLDTVGQPAQIRL